MKTLTDPRAIELFEELRALDPPARAERLESQTASDPQLRAELRVLLCAHDRNSGFLDAPALGKDFRLLDCLDTENPQPEIPALVAGDAVGPYRILQLLSRGEDASVYLARQETPVRRFTAVKILNSQLRRREVLKRFELERQSIAAMQHPNIATLYDAGTTDSGRAYFAMEYVEGRPITDACREDGLPIAERLRIFIQVCRAVEHAHQRGLIHRDLKPGNILVTKDDEGRSIAKLIDFGVARAVKPCADHSLTVIANQLIGTIAYMSPEQLTGSARLLDTRADVFALGRVLFEVLANRTPFDLTGLEYDAAIHKLLHETAPRLRDFNPELRGDLETIVQTAAAKAPAERYQSVAELRVDVQRFLEGRPIGARKPSSLYKARKFVARHRVSTIVVGAAFAIAIGAALSAWRADNARLELAMRLTEGFFNQTLQMERTIGEFGNRVPFIQRLTAEVEELHAIAPNDPRVQTMRAALLEAQGSVAQEASRLDAAESYFASALELREKLLALYPRDDARMMDLSIANVHLGDVAGDRRDLITRSGFYEKALQIDEQVAARTPRSARALSNLAWSYERIGMSCAEARRPEDAAAFFQKQLDTFRRLGEIAATAEVERGFSSAYSWMAHLAEVRKLPASERLEFTRKSMEHARAAVVLSGNDRHALRTLVIAESRYYSELSFRDHRQCKSVLSKLMEISDRAAEMARRDAYDDSLVEAATSILHSAAECAMRIPDFETAIALSDRALEQAQARADRFPDDKAALAQREHWLGYSKEVRRRKEASVAQVSTEPPH